MRGAGTNHRSRSTAAKPKSSHYVIPSDLSAKGLVEEKILADVCRRGFDDASFFAIKLAMDEAITNAIRHGNKLDRKKKVTIDAKITPSRCEIAVEDEGEGFDRTDVPDPRNPENLHKCTGRGILLMESYMDNVRYSHGGRRVRMIKLKEEPESPKRKRKS